MNKLFILLLSATFAFGAVIWDKQQAVKLNKDEPFRVIFHEQVQGQGRVVQHEFVLRWTLFVNEGLTVTIKYDGFNHHHVLHKRVGLDTFNLQLLPLADKELKAPYMSIVFEEFDDAQKQAYFQIYIKDNDRTNLEILSPNRLNQQE